MMSDGGLVIAVNGDMVTVQMKRTSACSRCGACKAWGEQEMHIEAYNAAGAKPGDRVKIAVEPGMFMQALGILYGIPFAAIMLGFFAGYYAGIAMNIGEYAALTGFGSGAAMAFLSLKAIKILGPKDKENRHRTVAVEVIR